MLLDDSSGFWVAAAAHETLIDLGICLLDTCWASWGWPRLERGLGLCSGVMRWGMVTTGGLWCCCLWSSLVLLVVAHCWKAALVSPAAVA